MTKNLGFLKKLNIITLAFFIASLLSVGTAQAMINENETMNKDDMAQQKRLIKKRKEEEKSPELNETEVQYLKEIIKNYPLRPTKKDYEEIGRKLKEQFPLSKNDYSTRRLRLEKNEINRKELIKKKKEIAKNTESTEGKKTPKSVNSERSCLKESPNELSVDLTNKEDWKVIYITLDPLRFVTRNGTDNLKKRKIGNNKNIHSNNTTDN